jgi:hypothetical protein
MGIRYVVKRLNVTPAAGQDLITIVSPANRRVELVEVSVNGRGTSSAAQVLEVGTSTGGTTGGGAITPTRLDPDSPAASSTVNTTWSTQPTMDANPLSIGFNALGGAYRWVKPAGGVGPSARNGANISLRCPTGAPTPQPVDVHIVFEEM